MVEPSCPEITNSKQRAFLSAFRESGNVRLACEVAGVARSSHYRWLRDEPAYQEAYGVDLENAADILEAEAYRRAVEGVEEPVGWYRGEAGGTVRKFSDSLTMFLLKGLRPERYGNRPELRAAKALENLDLTQLPDPLLERIANGEHPLAVLASAQPNHSALIPTRPQEE